MWKYEQLTGRLFSDYSNPTGEEVVAIGYSGHGEGKNNPNLQNVHDVGPLPVGVYDIGPPQDTVTHGPYVLTLHPEPDNVMYGRSGFLIHGDSVVHPGTASQGCIIMSRDIREKIWKSGDRVLRVVSGQTA